MPELSDSVTQRAQPIPRSFHMRSLLCTLLLLSNSFLTHLCFFSSQKDNEFCRAGDGEVKLFLAIGLAFFALVYLIECGVSASNQYLNNDLEIYEYEGYMRQLKKAAPRIGTKIQCYHYKDETWEKETYYDADGRKQKRAKKTDDKKITYEGSSYHTYNYWEDTTGHIMGVFNGGELVKLEVETGYNFGDAEASRKYNAHREEFIQRCRLKDDHLEHFPIFEIPGHQKYVLVKNKGTTKPCCLNICWYWVLSLLLLSWPYRLWFEFLAEGKSIKIQKVIYDQPQEDHIL